MTPLSLPKLVFDGEGRNEPEALRGPPRMNQSDSFDFINYEER